MALDRPDTPEEVELESRSVEFAWQWVRIGRLVLDEAGRLLPSLLPVEPAVYRIRIETAVGESLRYYIGQAGSLRERFEGYRSLHDVDITRDDLTAKTKNQIRVVTNIAAFLASDDNAGWIDVIRSPQGRFHPGGELSGVREDVDVVRVLLEHGAIAAEWLVATAPSLNSMKSIDPDWLLNDIDLRDEFY